MTFKVQAEPCATCVYRRGSPVNPRLLENAVRDPHGCGFASYRVCHEARTACCRGFWNAHKNRFPAGQIAQRLGLVEFVTDVGGAPEIKQDVKKIWS